MSFDPQLFQFLTQQQRERESSIEEAMQRQKARADQGVSMLYQLAQEAPDLDVTKVAPALMSRFGINDPTLLPALTEFQKAANKARKAEQDRSQQMALAPDIGSRLGSTLATNPGEVNASVQSLQTLLTDPQARSLALNLGAALAPSGRSTAALLQPEQIAADKAEQRSASRRINTEAAVANAKARAKLQISAEEFGDLPNYTPRLARAVSAGKAYIDPTTSFIATGDTEGKKQQKAQGINSLFSLLASVNATAEKFAENQGGQFGTGTVEEFKRQAGGDSNPYFAAFDNSRGQLQLILGQLRSGAVLTNRQEEIISKALPSDAELKYVNGKLAPSARARMRAFGRILESELLPTFEPRDRKAAQKAIRSSFDAMLSEARADTLIDDLAVDPEGEAALNRLR